MIGITYADQGAIAPATPVAFRTEDEFVAWLNTTHGDGWRGDSAGPDGYEVAVYVAAPAPLARVESILGYLWAGPMAGEWFPGEGVALIPGHVFTFALDTTKSQRDDVPAAWEAHRHWLIDGSPVRKTDRSGPGTRGTRACAGLGFVLVAWR